MKNNTLLKTSAVCTCVATLFCFTPILVIGLGAVGLSWVVGYLGYVLFPVLAIFALITVISLIMSSRAWSKRRRV